MRFRWRLLFVVVLTVVGLLGLSRPAFAQAQITIPNQASLLRLDKNGKTVTKRDAGLNPEGISYQDCVDDQQIQVTLQMTGFEVGAAVQAYASVAQDCTGPTSRAGATAVCWPVYDSGIPLQASATINIPVRKIMSGALQATAPDATQNICGKVDLSNVTIQFLYFAPGNTSTGTVAASVTIAVDTVGPLPPTGLRTKPGNTRITVEWDQISGGTEDDSGTSTGGGGVTDILGVRVYCDLQAPTTATADASTDGATDASAEASTTCDADANAGDGGDAATCTSGATTSTTTCSSPNFVQADGTPVVPDNAFDAKYLCGSFNGTGGQQITATGVGGKPLQNDTTYALALAGTDRFGNVGRLSSVKCEVPEVTTDFWDDYRNAGGKAGDGCSTTGSAPFGSIATLSIGVAMALSAIFRGRRRSRSHEANGR